MGVVRVLSAAVSQFLAWCVPRLHAKTVAMHRRYLGELLQHLGDVELEIIDRLSIEQWAATKHRLESARRLFRWLKKTAKWIRRNPFKGIEVPKSGRRTRVLLRRERILLRKSCRPGLYRASLALYEGAFRPSELRFLRWEWIQGLEGEGLSEASLTGGKSYAVFEAFKGRKRRSKDKGPRVVPISPRLGRLLWRMRRCLLDVRGCVFLTDRGRPWTENGLRCAWRRLRIKAAANNSVQPKGLVPYTLRHTRATDLARTGINQQLLADFLGHSDIRMTSWYIHASVSDLCAITRQKKKK